MQLGCTVGRSYRSLGRHRLHVGLASVHRGRVHRVVSAERAPHCTRLLALCNFRNAGRAEDVRALEGDAVLVVQPCEADGAFFFDRHPRGEMSGNPTDKVTSRLLHHAHSTVSPNAVPGSSFTHAGSSYFGLPTNPCGQRWSWRLHDAARPFLAF